MKTLQHDGTLSRTCFLFTFNGDPELVLPSLFPLNLVILSALFSIFFVLVIGNLNFKFTEEFSAEHPTPVLQ